MKHLEVKVYGRVQGVFYRLSTQREAKKLGLSGYVKNLDDGSVEIKVEGEENNLEKFLTWCRKGSIMSKVAKVEVEKSDNLENYEGFEIRR